MIPIIQTKLHNPPESNGNCMAACYASILEVPLSVVPTFEDMPIEEWKTALDNWLSKFNLQKVTIDASFEDFVPTGYCLAIGKTVRSKTVLHCAVYKNGQMVHDPHPSKSGLINVECWEVVFPFDPSILTRKRSS